MNKIAIIGGSGLDNPEILESPQEKHVETPYGRPSSPLICGFICGTEVVIISRHGKEHTIPPSQVNNQANIFALKNEGCTRILATTACGSLRDDIRRGDLVVPDQLIDFTRHRKITFFEKFEPGDMNHTPMADPFDKTLRQLLVGSAWNLAMDIHEKGTIITIEGPRFSTRAESKMFRSWGADLINMSIAPEAILSNEIGIPYAVIAMSTDYDSWKEDEEPVSWKDIIAVFNKNVDRVIRLLTEAISKIN